MSQASFPNLTPAITMTIGQNINVLLGSIAVEELALAHLMNAEAEKIQFTVGTLSTAVTFPPVFVTDILAINASVRSTLRDIIKKEMLLEFKFENILDLIAAISPFTPA